MTPELKKYTFKNLIGSSFSIDGKNDLKITDVIIPRIQRDYAQGRQGKYENRIRDRFLEALNNAIVSKQAITLDFMYGDVENNKLTLLDGQQRFTTLFLLHWYAAKKDGICKEEYEFLNSFSYETRFSSRDFCRSLIEKEIKFDSNKLLSNEIKDQAWYSYDWKNDPTVQSMLIMIDAIDQRFHNINNLWQSLVEDNIISFYFLPLVKMGLSDELYIKMNSRGKPLTDFEHFKAEFLEMIKEQDENLYKNFSRKIDIDWTDMLFPYRGENQIIDDEFMRYFKFVSHVLCYQKNMPIEYDEFILAKQLYSKDNENSLDNLFFLESAFDCWCGIDIKKFFDDLFYTDLYSNGKTKLYITNEKEKNLFLKCSNCHGEFSNNGRNRLFSLNDMLLFYAVLIYRLNIDCISDEDFRRRIRIVRNLVENSQFEIREYDQHGNNQMLRLLEDIDEIIKNGNILTEDRGFNRLQKYEEKEKFEWLMNNKTYQDELFKLEDHYLLKGTISIVGLENLENFSKFGMLFTKNSDKDLINIALLTIGDYSQYINGKTQLGVKTKDSVWKDLFHPTKQRNENDRFLNSSKIINELLSKISNECKDIKSFLENIIKEYLEGNNIKFDWKYYFIKYSEMRYDSYGMYWWKDENKPYEIITMHTEKYLSGKNWNAFSYTLATKYPNDFELSDYAHYGDKLKIKGKNIFIDILNDKFSIKEEDKEPEEVSIKQDEEGIDLEDRIETIYTKLKDMHIIS